MMRSEDAGDPDVQVFLRGVETYCDHSGVPAQDFIDYLVLHDDTMSPVFMSKLTKRGLVSVESLATRLLREINANNLIMRKATYHSMALSIVIKDMEALKQRQASVATDGKEKVQ